MTDYAILGQLALRSWSTYELAKEMRRNFHYFWPGAESRIYPEVKVLAAQGLVKAERSFVGQRPRNTYAITAAGQDLLVIWLAEPTKCISLEFEGLLRVFFASQGTRDQLLAALDGARADAEEMLQVAAGIRTEYLEGRTPCQHEVHLRAFIYDFLASYGQMVQAWADRTTAEVRAWMDLAAEGKAERGVQIFAKKPAR